MAVASKVDICNMALDNFGKATITSLTENTAEAQACVRQYDIARRASLIRSPWSFARKRRSLAETSNPLSTTWDKCFDLPNNSLKLLRLLEPGQRVFLGQPPIPHYTESGKVFCDVPDVTAYYIWDSEDVLSWGTLFDEVVALALALRLAPVFTRRKSDVDTLQDRFRAALNEAVEVDATQDHEQYTVYEGGYTDARDAGGNYGRRQADGSSIWG